MRDELIDLYERELSHLRGAGAEFAKLYPKIASRLKLEESRCSDPHVERLLEGFAFLAARIRLKLEDDLPEISENLLEQLYPHYLAPLPSMSIVQFEVDQAQLTATNGHKIERFTELKSKAYRGTACKFRTTQEVQLWPLKVKKVDYVLQPMHRLRLIQANESASGFQIGGKRVDARSAICIQLELSSGLAIADIELDKLNWMLHGDSRILHKIYEQVIARSVGLIIRDSKGQVIDRLDASSIESTGYSDDQSLFPYPDHAFSGYRLLSEYFSFPGKFMQFNMNGLQNVKNCRDQNFELVILLDDEVEELESKLDASYFRLGCSPIVNLFEQVADPIRIHHRELEYRVVPDQRRGDLLEVYTVNNVQALSSSGEELHLRPIHGYRHDDELQQEIFWHLRRRADYNRESVADHVWLSLIDRNYKAAELHGATLTVHATCSNGDLPSRLPFAQGANDFSMEVKAPTQKICCLLKPTMTRPPRSKNASRQDVLSHLSLNYLSLEGEGAKPLKALLRLYDHGADQSIQRKLSGFMELQTSRVVRRVSTDGVSAFCQGLHFDLLFDEEAFIGDGVYPFAEILERFLGLYVTINSFVEVKAKTQQRGEIEQWPPRAGERLLM